MSLKEEEINSTSIIIDIRNFTSTFKDFQFRDDSRFFEFIKKYHLNQAELANTISDDIHLGSMGDGILTIFKNDKDHFNKGYAYVLASHMMMTRMCAEFRKETGAHISFGIGADSGHVFNIDAPGTLNTYVGTVINRAARIEELTKSFSKTTTIIGNRLYRKLIKQYYPDVHAKMKDVDYDTLLIHDRDAVLASMEFMLQYVFDMPLKGIQGDAPIFRLSSALVNDQLLFWDVMEKLVGKEKCEEIKFFIS